MKNKRYGTNVCITGATSGIGASCVELFASMGFEVWGLSRSANKVNKEHQHIHLHCMDVTQEESVSSIIPMIWKEALSLTGSGIGIIIHCAGFGIGGAAEDTHYHDALAQFETNYFGILRVNQHILPLMRQQGYGMVVVLGSIAGRISIPFQSHYSASKFAIEAYIEALRLECAPYGIKASVVEAGDTKTPFTAQRKNSIPRNSPYEQRAIRAIAKMEKDEQKGYDPSVVAKVVYAVCQRNSPPVRRAVGCSYQLLMFIKRLLPDRVAELVIRMMYL